MDGITKCLDTYALIEITNENARFSHYLSSEFVITELTLVEFYSVILREHDERTADYWIKKLEGYAVPVGKDILIESVKFRQKNKNKGISFFDAVGYIFSMKNGYAFVTGDKEFSSFKNVEFVKK